jgi:hypothetical protein
LNRIFAVLAASVVVAGCASTGGSESLGPFQETSQEAFQAELRAQVESEIEEQRGDAGPDSVSFAYHKPYYFKEYAEYPGDEDVYTLQFTETESRTTPLTAEFEIEKIRYATEFERKRDIARDDEDYLRSRGVLQTSYQLRNGRWRKTGSIFIASNTERLVNGEWQQIEIVPDPMIEVQEESGGIFSWFRRR